MAWTPLLLMPLCHCTGSLAQAVLPQPPSLSASPGASARLPRTLSNDINVGGYRIFWYQRKPRRPPWFLLRVYSASSKDQGSRVPSLCSEAKDASASVGLLLISRLQPKDEADTDCNPRSQQKSDTRTSWLKKQEDFGWKHTLQKGMMKQFPNLCGF
uniref:Immunoglobulin V-set domain-containing protein n=1 Tax=Catagonus wagneri TaxID=51154 RepID=A0A8C3YGS9_9CETA